LRSGRAAPLDSGEETHIIGIADVNLLRRANVLLLRANFGVVPALARLSASEIPIVWVSAF
jgi:hypothetical protein